MSSARNLSDGTAAIITIEVVAAVVTVVIAMVTVVVKVVVVVIAVDSQW
jgi:hypothetical protein